MNRLLTIEGVDVNVHEDGHVSWLADMMIDADGAPHAYHPKNTGLDSLSSAGYPDSAWWKDILVTDGKGRPVVQDVRDPAPGYFISMTTYEHKEFLRYDPRRYVDAETVPYVVVPTSSPQRRARHCPWLPRRVHQHAHGQEHEGRRRRHRPAQQDRRGVHRHGSRSRHWPQPADRRHQRTHRHLPHLARHCSPGFQLQPA